MSDLATRRVMELSGSMTTKALTSSGALPVSGLHGPPAIVVAPANSGANAAIARPPAAERLARMKARRERAIVIGPASYLGEFGGAMHSGAHARIGAAAADIGHLRVDIRVARVRVVRKEGDSRHDLPRLAIAALWRVGLDPGLLDRVQLLLAEAFDGQDPLVGGVAARRDAGSRRLAVDDYGAGAAQSRATAEFCPDHPQFVPQRPQQRHLRLDVEDDLPPVHKEIDHRPGASIGSQGSMKESHG